MSTAFKDRHPELQQLVREHALLRRHNLTFKEGDRQDTILMFAEAGLIFMVLERFLRALLPDATDEETLRSLLDRAVARGVIDMPHDDQQKAKTELCSWRNAILHGNYEQLAALEGAPSVKAYFGDSWFAKRMEIVYRIVDAIVDQIDIDTGLPKKPTERQLEAQRRYAARRR